MAKKPSTTKSPGTKLAKGEPTIPRSAPENRDREAELARGREAFIAFMAFRQQRVRQRVPLTERKQAELITNLNDDALVGVAVAAAERFGELSAEIRTEEDARMLYRLKGWNSAIDSVLDWVLRRELPFTNDTFGRVINEFAKFPHFIVCDHPHYSALVEAIEHVARTVQMTEGLKTQLRAISSRFFVYPRARQRRLTDRVLAAANSNTSSSQNVRKAGPLEAMLLKRDSLPKALPTSLFDTMAAALVLPAEGDTVGRTTFRTDAVPANLLPIVAFVNEAFARAPDHSRYWYREEPEPARGEIGRTLASHGWAGLAVGWAAFASLKRAAIPWSTDPRSQAFHNGVAALVRQCGGALRLLNEQGSRNDAAAIGEICHALSCSTTIEFLSLDWHMTNTMLLPALAAASADADQAACIRMLRYRERIARQDSSRSVDLRAFDAALGIGIGFPLDLGERWTDRAFIDMQAMKEKVRTAWIALFAHCSNTPGSQPNAKWNKQLEPLLASLPKGEFESRIAAWLPLVGKARPIMPGGKIEGRESSVPGDQSADVLRGLAFACARFDTPSVAAALGDLAMACFKMVPGFGARCIKPGTSSIWALSQMKGSHALAQLSRVRQLVKFGTAKKVIDTALDRLAAELNLTTDELHEIAAPDFGLDASGTIEESADDWTLRLSITGSEAVVAILDDNNIEKKALPTRLKKDHADTLKALKAAAADIDRVLPAQKARIERLYQDARTWPFSTWKSRYLDHPLVGTIGRRLIWSFTEGTRTREGLWDGTVFLDERGQTIDPSDSATVSLWHPIHADPTRVQAWRTQLEDRRIVQPFKQAHREIYPLTEAERTTETYSNRFAAHVIKQNQLVPLCQDRGWKHTMFVLEYGESPLLHLPRVNLYARFEVSSIGDEMYGNAGASAHLQTDRVRFTRTLGGPDLRLDEIPPLVFSEVMRDVDLFVAVCSIGNNPEWNDGGPGGHYTQAWTHFSFGELTGSAVSRRETSGRIIPRLAIAPVCTITDRFLVVKGTKRTYKIHYGSGNILMEPNDQYLCIVPKSVVDSKAEVFLPFEGDRVLAIILSKAFMLAADDTITDHTILRQLGLR